MPRGKSEKYYRKGREINEGEAELRRMQNNIALELDEVSGYNKREDDTLDKIKESTNKASKFIRIDESGNFVVDEGDPEKWLKAQTLKLYRAVMKSAMKGNANSQRLAAQLSGKLIEKSEVKIGLTAEEYYRVREEAKRRVSQSLGKGDGDRSLLPASILPVEELRVDNKQEHGQDS